MRTNARGLDGPPDAGMAVHHLLIVAGPYASGKSTLLRQLRTGRLATEVTAVLPAGAARWMQTSFRKTFSEAMPDIEDGPSVGIRGVCLHYNILRPALGRASSFDRDPLLRLMGHAKAVTILTLRAEPAELIERFVARSLVEQSVPSRLARLRRWIRGLLKVALRRLCRKRLADGSDASIPTLIGRYRRVSQLYRQPGWLDARYREWEGFLADRASEGADLHAYRVLPICGSKDEPGFRLE